MAGKEIAFNAVGITDTDLDVILLAETGVLIDTITFPKDSTDGIVRKVVVVLITPMNDLNNSTIETTKKKISVLVFKCVFGNRLVIQLRCLTKQLISIFEFRNIMAID